MSLSPGQELELTVEKPASGGRMIARHEGQIVLVLGAIPGERVVARVDRVEKRLAFATTQTVIEPSPDRREVSSDPLCGGCVYVHMAYPRQVTIKGEVIADAFRRIGRMPLEAAVPVAASAEHGYRMRARLHVRSEFSPAAGAPRRKAGFYREGTHQLCDAGPTGQLLPATVETVNAALAALDSIDIVLTAIEVTENVAGDQRALHLVLGAGQPLGSSALEGVIAATRVTGCTSRTEDGQFAGAGEPLVSDPLPVLTAGRATAGELRRSPESFFQGNRHLLAQLVLAVIDAVPAEGEVLDLYAGVGLFSISLAGTGRQGITAVEGDRSSGIDLKRNAAPFGEAVRTVIGRVEDHLARRRAVSTIIVDPPRTGISKEAMDAIIRQRAERVVYVSCDPPTMARDARRLLDAGYRLTALQGFDLFPNTPHVEALGVFQR